MADAAMGLEYLHGKHVVHGDLKAVSNFISSINLSVFKLLKY
jgi:serine/threonine protein kinase